MQDNEQEATLKRIQNIQINAISPVTHKCGQLWNTACLQRRPTSLASLNFGTDQSKSAEINLTLHADQNQLCGPP
jgi:hypothetical protein